MVPSDPVGGAIYGACVSPNLVSVCAVLSGGDYLSSWASCDVFAGALSPVPDPNHLAIVLGGLVFFDLMVGLLCIAASLFGLSQLHYMGACYACLFYRLLRFKFDYRSVFQRSVGITQFHLIVFSKLNTSVLIQR